MKLGPRVFKIFILDLVLIEKYKKMKFFNKYKIIITVTIFSMLYSWQEHLNVQNLSRTHKFIGWEMMVRRPMLGV